MKASEKATENLKGTDVIKVLIADDDPPTRILLRAAISQWGYEVIEASNGEEAWQILQEPNPPRLLILDWLMPKLDGISLCERIKHEQAVTHPYTILLTQVTGTTNIIKGLEAGADEFLSKPFNMAELRSRLSVGARIVRFENALAEQNSKVQNYASQMETLSQSHAKQLVYHSDLLSMLGSLIEKISQELFDTFSMIEAAPEKSSAELKKIADLRQQFSSVIAVIKRLQVNSVYTPKTGVCPVNELIQTALSLAQSATRRIQIATEFASQLPPLSADAEQLQEVFLGLILSSAEAMKGQDQPRLRIETRLTPKNALQITLEDSGPQIEDTELKIMQQPRLIAQDLEQIRSRLSAAMSKEIIQKYGGSLSIENLPENGIRLNINLPLQIKSAERTG